MSSYMSHRIKNDYKKLMREIINEQGNIAKAQCKRYINILQTLVPMYMTFFPNERRRIGDELIDELITLLVTNCGYNLDQARRIIRNAGLWLF